MRFKERYESYRYEHATMVLTGQRVRIGPRHGRWTSFVLATDVRWFIVAPFVLPILVWMLLRWTR